MISNTDFDLFLHAQGEFMDIIGVKTSSEKARLVALREAAVGLTLEAAEVLEHAAPVTKPWKSGPASKNKELKRRSDLIEETVDVLFFVLEIFKAAGLEAEDVMSIYAAKTTYNYCRILESIGRSQYEPFARRHILEDEEADISDVNPVAKRIIRKLGIYLLPLPDEEVENFISSPTTWASKILGGVLWKVSQKN